MSVLLTDEQIEATKSEAERLSLTHKVHPRFEKEKYLLQAQLKQVVDKGDEWVIPMRETADLRELERAFEHFDAWWQALRREVADGRP